MQAAGGGGGRATVGAVTVALAAAGGTVGYAAYDPTFRKVVEDAVPGAEKAFSAVLGEAKPEETQESPPQKSQLKIPTSSAPPSKRRPVVQEVAQPEVAKRLPAESDKKEGEETLVVVSPPPLEKPSFIKEEIPKVEKSEPQVAKEKAKQSEEAKPTFDDPVVEALVQPKGADNKERREKRVAQSKKKEETELSEERSIMEGKDLHKQISLVKERLEAEMIQQLRRQAEAHAEFLDDSLDVQRRELTRRHKRELDEAVEKTELVHRQEISKILGHLRGLSDGLQDRSEMDAASLEAQELWLACSSILHAVASGSSSGIEVRSLYDEVQAVKKAVPCQDSGKRRDQFVQALLDSIPEEASTRGIYTEDSIRERFRRVEKMARRTAMIGDDGGSLFRYFLSYLQSLLVLSPSTDEIPSKSVPVDVDALSTFDLVWLARGHLERGDLDQAVRYVTLLHGEPRNVARDWLREARLLLETRQACTALMAHAAAIGVEALPVRREKKKEQ